MTFEQEFIYQSILRLNENTPRIEKCFGMLTESEIWHKPNSNSNSIGNLVLHLCGNITQYIISSLGNEADMRNRDLEFSTHGVYTKSELLKNLKDTLSTATHIIQNTAEEKLLKNHSVQGFHLTGIGIIIHVVEHYSYHTGQISFFTKLMRDQDLEYYADLDLNTKNETDQ